MDASVADALHLQLGPPAALLALLHQHRWRSAAGLELVQIICIMQAAHC
jgi:hypothetical protein